MSSQESVIEIRASATTFAASRQLLLSLIRVFEGNFLGWFYLRQIVSLIEALIISWGLIEHDSIKIIRKPVCESR